MRDYKVNTKGISKLLGRDKVIQRKYIKLLPLLCMAIGSNLPSAGYSVGGSADISKEKESQAHHLYADTSSDSCELALRRLQSNSYLKSLKNNRDICKITLTGVGRLHTVTVTPLAGNFLATSSNNIVKIWDLSQSDGSQGVVTCVTTLYPGVIRTITPLSDDWLAITSDDYTVKIWDLSKPDNREAVVTLKHPYMIRSITPLLSGNRLAIASNYTVKIWDLSKPDNRETVATLTHLDKICTITPLSDNLLAIASDDNTVKIWDLSKPDNREAVATLKHSNVIRTITPLSGNRLAIPSDDDTVKIWDLSKPNKPEHLATLEGHAGTIIFVTQMGDQLVTASAEDGTVKIWRNPSQLDGSAECVETLTRYIDSTTYLADGRLVSYEGGKMKICDPLQPEDSQHIATYQHEAGVITAVAPLDDGRLAITYGDNTSEIWDPLLPAETKRKCLVTLPKGSVTPLKNSQLAIVSSEDNSVTIWDLSAPKE